MHIYESLKFGNNQKEISWEHGKLMMFYVILPIACDWVSYKPSKTDGKCCLCRWILYTLCTRSLSHSPTQSSLRYDMYLHKKFKNDSHCILFSPFALFVAKSKVSHHLPINECVPLMNSRLENGKYESFNERIVCEWRKKKESKQSKSSRDKHKRTAKERERNENEN